MTFSGLDALSNTDDLEVAAVIAAVLAVYLDIPQGKLKIKSIKRANNNSAWGVAAIENNLRHSLEG